MAGGNEILQALMASQYKPSESGLGIAAQGIAGMSPILVNPYDSPGKNIGLTLGAGLLAGVLSGMARNDAEADNAALLPLQAQYLAGTPEQQAELVKQEPKLSALGSLLLASSLDRAQKVKDAQALIPVEVQKAEALIPTKFTEAAGQSTIDQMKELGQVPIPGTTNVVTIESPEERSLREAEAAAQRASAVKRAEMAAERAHLGNALPAKDVANLEVDYTTKLTTGPVAQQMIEIRSRGEQVLEAVKTRDPLHAATAIYGFAKVLDPQGVVRKEDGTIVADPGGPAGQLALLANQILQKGSLTDETVASMRTLVPKLVKSQYSSYAMQRDAMVEAAIKQGARRENIGFLPEPMLGDSPPPGVEIPPGWDFLGVNPQTGKVMIRKTG